MNALNRTLCLVIPAIFVLTVACGDDGATVNTQPDIHYADTSGGQDTATTEDTTPPQDTAPVCGAGETRCTSETRLQTCAVDGSGWVEADCSYKCMIKNDKAGCYDKVCEPGSHRCAGAYNLMVCVEQGTEYDELPCPTGSRCDPTVKPEPECVSGPTCVSGNKECDETGKYLKICVKSGDSYTYKWEKCSYGCDPATLTCKEPSCEAGDHRCSPADANVIEECNKEQSGWKFVQACAGGCDKGECIDMACSPGDLRCNYYAVEVCDEYGNGYKFLEGCPTACVQEGNVAYCAGCVAGEDYCEGNAVMTCDDPSAPAVKQQCQGGDSCVLASCAHTIVMSNFLEKDGSYNNLAMAVTQCWQDNVESSDNVMCGVIDASEYTVDTTAESFIDAWYCDNDIWWDVIWPAFESAGLDIWEAEGIFSCFEMENRVVDMKDTIPAGSKGEICVWFDTFAVDEVIIEDCDNF